MRHSADAPSTIAKPRGRQPRGAPARGLLGRNGITLVWLGLPKGTSAGRTPQWDANSRWRDSPVAPSGSLLPASRQTVPSCNRRSRTRSQHSGATVLLSLAGRFDHMQQVATPCRVPTGLWPLPRNTEMDGADLPSPCIRGMPPSGESDASCAHDRRRRSTGDSLGGSPPS